MAFQKQDYRSAIASYDRALEALQGNDRAEAVKCWTNRAMAQFKVGDMKQCAADCSAALALDPECVKAR